MKILDALKARVDNDGMVPAPQDIYTNALTDLADSLLPTSPWGEDNFAKMQGERRLRLYSKIMDHRGESKPDWWIIAQVGNRMGFDGFEETSQRPAGTVHDYVALVEPARSQGKSGDELRRELGTTGIQFPIKLENGSLAGTLPLHRDSFGTKSGKAVFPHGDWSDVEPFQQQFAPQGDELWVSNMRSNEHWQSQLDDSRIAYRWERFPANILEINHTDAAARGIESGDRVEVKNLSLIHI